MRKRRSPEIPADDELAVNHQIVVPKIYRSEILSLAHETPMSGHLGVNKTYHKIQNLFLAWFKGRCFKLLQVLSYLSGGRETWSGHTQSWITTNPCIYTQFEVCYCSDLTLTADKHLLNNESEMCVGPTADSPLKQLWDLSPKK